MHHYNRGPARRPRGVLWTAELDAILRAKYPSPSVKTKDLLAEIKRLDAGATMSALTKRASVLGLNRPQPSSAWSEDNATLLRVLFKRYAGTETMGWIAQRYNRESGEERTRNMVIAKCNRMGLQHPRPPGGGRVRKSEEQRRQEKLKRNLHDSGAPAEAVYGPPSGVPLLGLERHHCRYPVGGEGRFTRFCGQPVTERRGEAMSECEHHYELSHTQREPKTGKKFAYHVSKFGGAHIRGPDQAV